MSTAEQPVPTRALRVSAQREMRSVVTVVWGRASSVSVGVDGASSLENQRASEAKNSVSCPSRGRHPLLSDRFSC